MNILLRLAICWLLGLGIAMAGTTPPNKLTAAILWNQILAHRTTYIQEGHRGPIVYDFQDPNCPYCHVLYENEAPLIKDGKLTVRYVPVAFLTPSSPAEAAEWLQSAHPLVVLQHFEQIVGNALRRGNMAHLPKALVIPTTGEHLHTNLTIMKSLGIMGTPAVAYRMKNGKIGIIPGLISQKHLITMLPRFASDTQRSGKQG